MATTTTPSPGVKPDKRLSPEVTWYLESRGIPYPDCPPLVMTPEPRLAPGATFSAERVDRVLAAIGRLRHTQGRWAGQTLKPDPWQIAYFLAPIFGWVEPSPNGDGFSRIIRKAYLEVPRKNGKTTLAGGIALYLMAADDEPGAQVYAIASGKDQARYCFDPIKRLVEGSPDLKPHLRPMRDKILHKRSGNFFQVVSAIADLLHGSNPHGAIIDELHVHKTPDLVDAIESGMGAREQPLELIITTAGDESPTSIYAMRHERIVQLSSGVGQRDPSVFGVIWAANPKDDPFAESTWRKANPGYGISPSVKYLESEALSAQSSPSDRARFLRFHLNIRTSSEHLLIPLRDWDRSAGRVDELKLEGRECYAGLDLSKTRDMTALCLIFPPADPKDPLEVIWRLWLPEEGLEERARHDRAPYQDWINEGWIRKTPGAAIDFETIERDILADSKRFRLMRLAYDEKYATQLAQRLEAQGLEMFPMGQGMAAMGPPTSDLIALVKDRRFHHGGNPVMRLQISGTKAETDAYGAARPSKRVSTVRIDGVVAAVMGVSQLNLREPEGYSWGLAG